MIIIGNGPSILDKKLGEKIDSFSRVCRFNDYKISGFESFAGTKTTDWWNTVNFQNTAHPLLQKSYNFACLHSWNFKEETDKLWQKQKPLLRAEKIIKSQEAWIFELQQFLGTSYYGFSTGVLAIWYYLKSFDKVTIHGFDNFNPDVPHHYNAKDGHVRGVLHNGTIEKQLIEKLAAAKKIQFLN